MSVTVSSSIRGSERAEPEHVGDQRSDEPALLDEIQLYLALGEQIPDPAAELRLEHRARHIGRRRDVHVFEHERLNVGLAASIAARLERREPEPSESESRLRLSRPR